MENASIVPVMDVNRGYGYGDGCYNGGGMWFMWIIVLFALMGGWGNGYGRNGAGLTQVEMQQGFDTQSILRKLDGIQNGLCDGFYAQNSTMLQGFNGTQREILDSRYQLGNQIAENRFAQQQCCCELKSEGYRNTCEITNAIHAEGEATRALIQHNVMQELRDKLADRDRDLQSANFQLSQLSQTANIVGTLRPFPQPAYITASPYQSVSNYCGYGYGGCGC
jgi:hypothetical protein